MTSLSPYFFVMTGNLGLTTFGGRGHLIWADKYHSIAFIVLTLRLHRALQRKKGKGKSIFVFFFLFDHLPITHISFDLHFCLLIYTIYYYPILINGETKLRKINLTNTIK